MIYFYNYHYCLYFNHLVLLFAIIFFFSFKATLTDVLLQSMGPTMPLS